jgi:hypothetical protein
MTDRAHSLLVVLDHDVRVDDVEPLANAICQLRGVAAVTAQIADGATYMAEVRAKQELSQKLLAVLRETRP